MALLGIYGQATINQGLLHDSGWMRAYLGDLCLQIGMTPVGAPVIEEFPHWPGGAPSGVQFIDDGKNDTITPNDYPPQSLGEMDQGGNTGVQVLKESAITMHTYPEHDALELVIDSCNPIPDAPAVGKGLYELFGLRVPRGGLVYERDWSWAKLEPKGFMQGAWWNGLKEPGFMHSAPPPDEAWDAKIKEHVDELTGLSYEQGCFTVLAINFDQAGFPNTPHIHNVGKVTAEEAYQWFKWSADFAGAMWMREQAEESLREIGEKYDGSR